MSKAGGHVYLVGAGPGPADLLTLRARDLVQRAEVLAYDDLVHPSLLELAPAGCELMAIGYRAGEQADRPPPLHPEVLARAQAGLCVVRLKSGDPLIFGRGGEEAAALMAADIPFSFVPGITAALAAASACNLPLTWRGRASELRISTQGSSLAPPATPCTWALYMPRHGIQVFAAQLLEAGWPGDTPAAFVIAAAHRQQQCVRRPLHELAAAVASHHSELPGLVIVGEALRESLPYQAPLASLQGCRILLARAHADPSRLLERLLAEGADAWAAPWIRTRTLCSELKFGQTAAPLGPGDAPFKGMRGHALAMRLSAHFERPGFILVASASAFEGFVQFLKEQAWDLRHLQGQSLLTIGAARGALQNYLLQPAVHFRKRQSLLKEWPHQLLATKSRGLILGAGEEGDELQAQLASIGTAAEVLVTADFEVQYPRIPSPRPDFIIAPHQKALQCLLRDPGYRQFLQQVQVLAFGSRVAALARELGCTRVIDADIQQADDVIPLLKTLWHPSAQHGDSDGKGKGKEGPPHPLHGAW